ncbi:MAG: Ig-like domain-containing protein, partial [Bacteroidia bacterium]|nr:Ig-like domain-containing protein [Bacteroidia bacterium]
DNYSVEVQSANKLATGGLGIDVRSKTGRRVFVSILGQYVVDEINHDTLARNIDNSTMANYRLSVEGTTASVYKDSVKVGTVSTDRTDFIPNAGLENKNIDFNVWGGSLNWTKPYIDSVAANVHSGKYSLRWRNRYTGIFRVYMNVQPNSKYRLSFWAKVAADSSKIFAMSGGIYMGGLLSTPLTVNKLLYTQYSLDFTTTSDCNEAIMQLNNVNNLCLINFDDFVLTQLEGKAYMQFGKLIQTNAADITTRYVAYSPQSSAPILKTDLTSLLAQAKSNVAGASIGYSTNQYPQYAVDRINAVIARTDLALVGSPTYGTIDTSYYNLDKANTQFLQSKITDGNVKLTSIQLTIDNATIKEQLTSQLTVTGLMSNGQPAGFTQDQIVFNLLGNSIVSISATGLVTGLAPGTAKIEVVAHINEVILRDTIDIQVVEYKLTTVDFQAYQTEVEVGEATGTKVTILMTGNSIPDAKYIQMSFHNLTPTIADVTGFGSIIAKMQGEAKIAVDVTVLGITRKDTVTIQCVSLSSTTLSVSKTLLDVNDAGSYTFSAVMSTGNAVDVSKANALVVTDNRNIVQLDNKGNLKALKVGTTTIRFIVNRNGKTLTQTVSVEVKNVGTALSKNHLPKNEFSLFPNPASNVVNLIIPVGAFVQLKLLNGIGQECYTQKINKESEISIPLNTATGNYFVQLVHQNNETATQKLIIR